VSIHGMKGRVVDGLDRGDRIDCAGSDPAINRPQDDVARQHCAQVPLDADCVPGNLWVAGPKDQMGRHLDIQLFLHGRGDVDLGQNAKAAIAQRLVGARTGFGKSDS
jgi:hypothetical protein